MNHPRDVNCIFCQIVQGMAPSWKIYETDDTLAFLDINPVNEYHTLVIPKHHYVNYFDVPPELLLRVTATVKQLVDLYHRRLGIDNVQIISCAGEEAQQDVFHFHVHIVPRHQDDGQDVVWHVKPEMRARFSELAAAFRAGIADVRE